MTKVARFATARDVFMAFPTAAKDIGVEPNDDAPATFARSQAASGKVNAAISFCAYLLERRRACWWACESLRGSPLLTTPQEMLALGAAEQWVRQPEERLREAAYDAARQCEPASAAAFVAFAAAFAGPSLKIGSAATGGSLPARIGPQMTAHCVRGAFLLAALRLPPSQKTDYLLRWLEGGLRLAQEG